MAKYGVLDIIPIEARFNESIYFHNLNAEFMADILKETVASGYVEGLTYKHVKQAIKMFSSLAFDQYVLTDKSIIFLHRLISEIEKMFSYNKPLVQRS